MTLTLLLIPVLTASPVVAAIPGPARMDPSQSQGSQVGSTAGSTPGQADTEVVPTHADIHPADSDLFFEMPLVRELRTRYGEVPLQRVLTDPRLTGALKGMGLSEEDLSFLSVDSPEELAGLFEELDVPAIWIELATALYFEAETISFSLSGLGGGSDGDASAGAVSQIRRAGSDLDRIWWDLANRKPQSFESANELFELLGLPEDARTDPWGRPYLLDGAAGEWPPTPRTLGRDGKVGGALLDADLRPGSWQVDAAAVAFGDLRLRVAVDFSSEQAAADAAGVFRNMPQLRVEQSAPGQGSTNDEASWLFTVRDFAHHGGWIDQSGARLVLGFGVDPARDHGRFAASGESNLPESAAYQRGIREVGEAQGTVVVSAYGSMSLFQMLSLLVKAGAAIGAGDSDDGEVPEVTVLDQLSEIVSGAEPQSSYLRTVFTEGAYLTEGFRAEPTGPQGLGRWLGSSPIDQGALRDLPADTMMAYVTTLDGPVLGDVLLSWLEEQSGRESSSWLEDIESNFGFNPKTDLFDNLGGTATVQVAPVSGLGVPATFVIVGVSDAENFWSALDGFTQLVAEELGSDVEAQSKEYRKVPYIVVDVGAGANFKPTFAVIEDKLYLTTSSKTLKREIKRRQSARSGSDAESSDAESSVAESSDAESSNAERHPLAAGGIEVPASALSVYYMDWGKAFEGAYSLLKSFAPMAQGFLDLPFDLSELPPAEFFTDHIGPSVRVAWHVEGGVRTREVSSFGPEVQYGAGIGFFAGASAAALLGTTSQMVTVEATPRELPPAPPAPDDPALRTRLSFVELRNGIEVYRQDQGQYPPSLAALTEPTKNFPRGFLDTYSVPADGWGRPIRYAPPAEGETYRLWSVGPDGVDQERAGDDLIGK